MRRTNAMLVLISTVAVTLLSANHANATEDSVVAPNGTGPHISGSPSGSTGELRTDSSPCKFEQGQWWCDNRFKAPIYKSGTSQVIDHLWSTTSWFVCRSDNGGHVGGPHPNRWEWTQGDEDGLWGWVKDTDISSETDPLPVC